ncbi:TPA: ANR family transcriptional regulator [Enterobacter hormaechei subsp. xiangfangensis]|nr:ANR family transcriptional regulator [Enterobacter hormaechei subsp. xiangfangensis]
MLSFVVRRRNYVCFTSSIELAECEKNMFIKKQKDSLNETGIKIAASAAMLERGGDYESAFRLWLDSVEYPCDKSDLVWRQKRANYCEYQALKAMRGSLPLKKQNH